MTAKQLEQLNAGLQGAYEVRFPYTPRFTWEAYDDKGELFGFPEKIKMTLVDFEGVRYIIQSVSCILLLLVCSVRCH
jgi:hypothetical protein